MSAMPEMGRNHFAALFSVIASLGLGTAPVLWGLMLDALGTFEAVTGALVWRKHAVYFLALLVLDLLALALVGRIMESRGAETQTHGLADARIKRLGSLWQRG